MGSAPLSKVNTRSAADVCAKFALSDEAKALLKQGVAPAQYLDLLMDKQIHIDAAKFLAHALPKREAVWWGCTAAKVLAGPTLTPQGAAAIKSAEKWVADPSEENRRAAMPAAEAAGFGTAPGCAALAVFFSGGSLGPPTTPPVPPAEHLTADAVAGCIMMAVVSHEAHKSPERYKLSLTKGIDIANGRNLWK